MLSWKTVRPRILQGSSMLPANEDEREHAAFAPTLQQAGTALAGHGSMAGVMEDAALKMVTALAEDALPKRHPL